MIEEIVILVLKTVGVLACLVLLRAIQVDLKVRATVKRLSAQGIFSYPGNGTFLVGPTIHIENEYQKRLATKEPIPVRLAFGLNLLSEGDRAPGEPPFNAEKYPMVCQSVLG